MKNIHLIPTDKPSRLGYLTKKGKEVFKDLRLFDRLMPNILDSENQNIYITSDEEIKEGDWFIRLFDNIIFKANPNSDHKLYECKKIILTTDQDLINDGVQAIDDKFLEWFVKNPSCEWVETYSLKEGNKELGFYHYKYEIIITKEEPKQEYEYIGECKGNDGNGCFLDSCGNDCGCFVRKPKQETLEEASEYYAHNYFNMHETNNYKALKQGFEAGAKWQQERMYSEKDILDAWELGAREGLPLTRVKKEKLFNLFKNK